jgi:hypothetical protein
MTNDRSEWDEWDWLKAATDAGWKDPDVTEPLDVTVQRAKEYLERLSDREQASSGNGSKK